MNRFSKLAIAALFVASPLVTMTSAHAVSPNFPSAALLKINSDGFRTCKALGNSGYTAVARGLLGDGGGGRRGAGDRPFQLRTCFETASQCERFLDRIHHRISQIEQLNYIGCTPRG